MTLKVESTHDDGGLRWLVTTETETHEPGRLAWLRANSYEVLLGLVGLAAALVGGVAMGSSFATHDMDEALMSLLLGALASASGVVAIVGTMSSWATPKAWTEQSRRTYYSSQGLAWWHADGRLEPAKDDNPRAIPTGERARVPEPLNGKLVELYAAAETERMRERKPTSFERALEHEGCEIPFLHTTADPSWSWAWNYADDGNVITSTTFTIPDPQ